MNQCNFFNFCCMQSYLEQGEHEYLEAEPEEVARRGHYYQTRSRKTSFGPRAKLHNARSCDDAETKQMKRYINYIILKKQKMEERKAAYSRIPSN